MSNRHQHHYASTDRIGGLDGLRAIAVSLVLVYHLFPGVLPGGFLGVDIFFVISGFLITTLLLSEKQRKGFISLVPFWQRRARRLLPALAIVLLVCTSMALAVGGDLLVNIGAQIAGAAAFVANWVYIALGADYFAHDNPELYRNTWSLAIEEQFYLLLPLVLLLAFYMRARATRTLFFGILGLASAWWMAALHLSGAPATRVYFGTDTHTFGLLLGVALACALRPSTRGLLLAARPPLAVWQQLALLILGAAGLCGLAWLALTLREGSPESFLGGFQLATALMLVVMWAATRQGSWLGLGLDVQPLRWIGERSYGIYLWHWPLLLLLGESLGRGSAAMGAPWAVPTLVLALTFVVSAVSYRFVEQPIRRFGLRKSIALLARPVRLHGRRLAIAVSALVLFVVTVPSSAIAIATAPVQSTSAEAINRGSAALQAQQTALAKQAKAPSKETSLPGAQLFVADDDLWADEPEFVPPPPVPIESWEVYAIGDSVMLASVPELTAAFPEIWIDASVSRGLAAGVGIVRGLADEDELRAVIVVGLGTNGPIDNADLEELRGIVGSDGRIVLVNAYADRWWTEEVNRQLTAFADAHRGVVLADWAGSIAGVPDALAGDDIHPNPSGGVIYAQVVQQALDALIERDELPERQPRS